MSKAVRRRVCFAAAWVAAVLTLSGSGDARADETVSIGGSQAVLLRPAAPKASVILMPGGDGEIAAGPGGQIGRLKNNQLVRTRKAYQAHGLAVLVVDANVNLATAVDYMRKIKSPVTVIGTSRGTLRAAQGIARGARPDALVLTSGFLTDASGSGQNVANILGSPGRLPKTLVIHHRQDGCRVTSPAGVVPFIK
jgi:glycerate-2-kinase